MAKIKEQHKELAKNLASGMTEVQAYLQAGFGKGNTKYAQGNAHTHIEKLMKNNEFKAYYDSLLAPRDNKRFKTVEDIHEFWASILDDPKATMQDKLRASEDIAKTRGMFINQQKVEVSGGLPVFIRDDVNE